MKFFKKNTANFLTLLNLFFGFTGILMVFYNNFVLGSYFLFLAALADISDGFAARLLNTISSFGKQLDSLADMVSFGILPAVIMHSLILHSHQAWVYEFTYFDIPVISFVPFIIIAAVAVRLARFNNNDNQKYYFSGLPSPANGLFIASLPLIIKSDLFILGHKTIYLEKYLLNGYILISICLLLAASMLIKFPVLSLKFQNFSFRKNILRYFLIIAFIIFYILFHNLSIPVIIIFYVLLSLIFKKTIIQNSES